MAAPMSWSERMLAVIKWCNSFYERGSSRSRCKPFLIAGQKVGLIRPDVLVHLEKHPSIFTIKRDSEDTSNIIQVSLSPSLSAPEERTSKVDQFLQSLRQQDVFVALKGWRDEKYAVNVSYHTERLTDMERSATGLFGTRQYGVHINGYCTHPTKGVCMWIGRRSPNKQTFPNQLDNVAAGGLPAGMPIMECLMKECEEEASIPPSISKHAKPVGSISYFYEDDRGLFPETQFLFDLELPPDFIPQVCDGEASEFYLYTVEEVKEKIASTEFKPNCALVVLDFLIRHGYISPDKEPYFLLFLEGMHENLSRTL
ncbi:uncharacterized protein [Amphiura filiformis]|uniref:uncharacterized protein n=1 Tax=Amphiura filiformis TaxID=82378 RepID=UPI003B20F821